MLNTTNMLPELVKARDSVKDTIKQCENLIESKKDSVDPREKRLIAESLENLQSLKNTLEKLNEKIDKIKMLH